MLRGEVKMEYTNGNAVEAKDWNMNGNTEKQKNGIQHHDDAPDNHGLGKGMDKALDLVSSTSTASSLPHTQ